MRVFSKIFQPHGDFFLFCHHDELKLTKKLTKNELVFNSRTLLIYAQLYYYINDHE